MDLLDFWSIYISGSIQLLMGFYFFLRFLRQKGKIRHYVVFDFLGIVVTSLFPAGSMAEFCMYIMLLTAAGLWISVRREQSEAEGGVHFWELSVLLETGLYAAVTAIIMMLSYGMMKALLTVFIFPHLFEAGLFGLSGFRCMENSGIALMLLGDGVALFFSFCSYHIVNHYLLNNFPAEKMADEKKKWRLLFALVPVCLIFLFGISVNSDIYGNCVITGQDGGIKSVMCGSAELFGWNHYRLFVLQVLGIVSLFFVLFAYRKLAQDGALQARVSLLEQEAFYRKQYVEEAKLRYDKTRTVRHDIKNNTLILKALLQSKQHGQALEYLGEVETMAEEMFFPCHTNGPVLDILLGQKMGVAQSKGIAVSCALHLPYPCGVKDIDLCTIFFNALDNAIQACEKCKKAEGSEKENRKLFIHVAGKRQGDFLLFEVKNSFDGGKTYKKGIGLRNIQSVAEKYHGTVCIETEDGGLTGQIFVLRVLLNISRCPESISRQND